MSIGTKFQGAAEAGLEIDSLEHRENDSVARRIFITYTTHIPWMIGRNTRPTREDEACYKAMPRAKAK